VPLRKAMMDMGSGVGVLVGTSVGVRLGTMGVGVALGARKVVVNGVRLGCPTNAVAEVTSTGGWATCAPATRDEQPVTVRLKTINQVVQQPIGR